MLRHGGWITRIPGRFRARSGRTGTIFVPVALGPWRLTGAYRGRNGKQSESMSPSFCRNAGVCRAACFGNGNSQMHGHKTTAPDCDATIQGVSQLPTTQTNSLKVRCFAVRRRRQQQCQQAPTLRLSQITATRAANGNNRGARCSGPHRRARGTLAAYRSPRPSQARRRGPIRPSQPNAYQRSHGTHYHPTP